MRRSWDLYPALPLFVVCALSLTADPLQGQVITGRLLAAFEDRPISDGVVHFLSPDSAVVASAVSDEEGRFVLAAPGPGWYLVRGEAAFHESVTEGPVELWARDTLEVELRLLALAFPMDPLEVEVEGRVSYLEREGFYDRARSRGGSFITREDIDQTPKLFTSDVLRGIPGVYVTSGGMGVPEVYLRRRASFQGQGVCDPTVYIDNFRHEGGGAVNLVRPEEVVGIEVYNSQLRVPAAYAGGLTGCGVILIWTRE